MLVVVVVLLQPLPEAVVTVAVGSEEEMATHAGALPNGVPFTGPAVVGPLLLLLLLAPPPPAPPDDLIFWTWLLTA